MASSLPQKGDERADAIYVSVGVALSYWESLEDVLFDCFVAICGPHEPTAVEAYLAGDRQRRFNMLRSACDRYGPELPALVADKVVDLAKRSGELAKVRNQIAHGRCQKCHSTVNGEVVMDGNYLMPSQGYPWVIGAPKVRYALTSASINEFTENVRDVRWELVQIKGEITNTERYQSMFSDPKITKRLFQAP